MIIRYDPVNINYVLETRIDLPDGVIAAYDIHGVTRNHVSKLMEYRRPSWLPNLQHLVDYIVTREAVP